MPLVIPGLQSKDNNKNDQTSRWSNELLGKKIGDVKNETTFAKSDLPQEHRIVKEDGVVTMDFKPERLNVHVGDDGTVRKVTHG